MAVNVKLLRAVKRLIQEEPRRLDMHVWGRKVTQDRKSAPPCGTTACLAGWIVLAATPPYEWEDVVGDSESKMYNFASRKGGSNVANLASQLVGIPEGQMPFMQMTWNADRVIQWIDSKIAEVEAQGTVNW